MGCYNSCVVNAPVDRVWTALRDFHDMSWAPQVITSFEKVGDATGDQIGAKRLLNGVFHETLRGLDDTDRGDVLDRRRPRRRLEGQRQRLRWCRAGLFGDRRRRDVRRVVVELAGQPGWCQGVLRSDLQGAAGLPEAALRRVARPVRHCGPVRQRVVARKQEPETQ